MNLDLAIQTADPVHLQIARFLRQRIHDGKLRPEERLPTTGDLVRQWRVDCTAVQRAMVQLVAEGLIERQRGRGTFVRPITARAVIGVLIGPSLSDETAYFYRAVLKWVRAEVAGMEDRHWACRVYDGLTETKLKSNVNQAPVYQHLVEDLSNYSFKGMVRLHSIDEPTEPGATLPQARLDFDVILDYSRFAYDTLQFIAQRGCRKIVYLRTLANRPKDTFDLQGLKAAVRALNLPQVEIHQMQNLFTGGVLMEQEAYERTLQLSDQWQRTGAWPDALLVSDDIAARGVALALASKGIPVPQRLLVVTQASEGIAHHYGIPILRYEFSPQLIARELLNILWKRMLCETLPNLPIRVAGQIKETEA